MREILFRAKRKDLGKCEWVYGTGIVPVKHNTYDTNEYEMIQEVNYDELDYCFPSYDSETINTKTLGQYTGLKDKNGKKIFEGDIVQFIYRDVKFIGEIKYGVYTHSKCDEYNCHHYGYYIDTQWEAYCKNTGFDLYKASKDCECEVIGNIYENPKLLEKENKDEN